MKERQMCQQKSLFLVFYRFTVNFLRGSDIAFHINPRFNEGGKQVVVRNHKVGDRWGTEERDLKGPFPFALGSPFEVSGKTSLGSQ